MNARPRTRFAPSPSGFLHLGNIRTALFNYLAAHHDGGEMLLRIEDTDQTRSSDSHIDAIVEDLIWLGLNDSTSHTAPLRQSQQHATHENALRQLLENGNAYPCFCSPAHLQKVREEQRRQNKPPRYDGTCANLSPADIANKLGQLLNLKDLEKLEGAELTDKIMTANIAIRFRMSADDIAVQDLVRGEVQFSGLDIGDFIIRRTDGGYAFFFANAIDDASSNISHVLRGEDHLSNTPRQMAILHALKMPCPKYGHLPLLTNTDGGPLSKREGALSVADLRARGILPQALLNYLARVGLSLPDEELHTLNELAQLFSYNNLSSAPAAFDIQQLLHRQKQAIQKLLDDEISSWLSEVLTDLTDSDKEIYIDIARQNALFPEDIRTWRDIAESSNITYNDEAQAILADTNADFFVTAAAALDDIPQNNKMQSEYKTQWKNYQQAVSTATNCRGRALFMLLRAAWTGRLDGPDMPTIFQLLGIDKAKQRLLMAKNNMVECKAKI